MDLSRTTKEIHFVTELPSQAGVGHYVMFSGGYGNQESTTEPDLNRVDINSVYRSAEKQWKQAFVDALGRLNYENAALEWWAFTVTAKNLLSSTLGNKIFETLALCKIIDQIDSDRLYVVGADPTQARIFKAWCDQNDLFHSVKIDRSVKRSALSWIETLLRNVYHVLRVFRFFFLGSKPNPELQGPIDICLFTYMDENLKDGEDAFFGELLELIHAQRPKLRVQVTGFVHSRYSRVLPKLRQSTDDRYYPIYFTLRLHDLWWAVWKTIRVRVGDFTRASGMKVVGLDVGALLNEALQRDVVEGRYFHNLLVYRAVFRFASKYKPGRLIYPYENKSLEKLLLIGVRRAYGACKLIGYQHTSITPRHTTLLFAKDEATKTPLPDRILTVGHITKAYLEEHGNYPAGIFEAACALRQVAGKKVDVKPVGSGVVRVLLALSSSRLELIESVSFMRKLRAYDIPYELGIRPHPEFPLTILSTDAGSWVSANALDYSGTVLASNLDWCDVVAYVSSTVALEALMMGRPTINFQIGDPVNSDPLLGKAPFCWYASTPEQFRDALSMIRSMSDHEYNDGSSQGRRYASEYLRPPSAKGIAGFLS